MSAVSTVSLEEGAVDPCVAVDDSARPPRGWAAVDVWPRTTRLLPWLLAAFLAMIWLVPFNSVTANVSLPVDSHLDRLFLPLILGLWAGAVAIGGPSAPRLRATAVHKALFVLIVVAIASVVVNLGMLDVQAELALGLKKLAILISYALIFFLVASSVRRAEVGSFMTFALGLACISAVGTIYEYRTGTNLFYEATRGLLPSEFTITSPSAKIDALGRRNVYGPGESPLEIAALLAMAVALAVVGVMTATRRRTQLLYVAAAALLVAGMMSTYRKSGLVEPVGALVVLIAYRPKALVRLVPLAAVLLVLVHFVAPGALGSVVVQFHPNRLQKASTVNTRTADYDAVHPDLFAHPLVGRGFGTYDPFRYRFLDNQYLHSLIEIGLLGLAAYLAVIGAVFRLAHRAIRAGRGTSRLGLALAGAAGAYAVSAALFDQLSFPHVPYLFFFLAGLGAAALPPTSGTSGGSLGRGPALVRRTKPYDSSSALQPSEEPG